MIGQPKANLCESTNKFNTKQLRNTSTDRYIQGNPHIQTDISIHILYIYAQKYTYGERKISMKRLSDLQMKSKRARQTKWERMEEVTDLK